MTAPIEASPGSGVALKQMLFRESDATASRADYLRLLGTRTPSSSSASRYRSSSRSRRCDAIDATASLRLCLLDLAPAELVMASCFEELDVDVPEIMPGSRTRGRAIGPALLWRSLAFAGLWYCGARTPYIIPAMARGRRCSRRSVPRRRNASPRPPMAVRVLQFFSV